MTSDRVPAEFRDDTLAFDPRSPSPLVRRGLIHLADRAADLVPLAAPFSLLWKYDATMATSSFRYPAHAEVEGSLVYLHKVDDRVTLDARTGTERWHIGFDPDGWLVQDGLALLVHGDDRGGGVLCALDAVDATPLWCSEPDPEEWTWPLLVDHARGNVYARVHWDLVALDSDTGIERWRVEASGETEADGVVRPYEDLALVWDPERRILVLSAATGAKQWRSAVDYNFPNALIRDGMIWIVDYSAQFVSALDLKTGQECWRMLAPTTSEGLVLKAVSGDFVYIVGVQHVTYSTYHLTLHALNASTGTVQWQRRFESEQGTVGGVPYVGVGQPVTGHEALAPPNATTCAMYLGDCRNLYALDPVSGEERWRFQLGAPDDHFPVYPWIGTLGVYVANHGHLSALDPKTGDLRWGFERTVGDVRLGCRVCSEVGDVVYVVSADNSLYALDARTGVERDRFEFSAAPSVYDLFDPILQWIWSGDAQWAAWDAKVLRTHSTTAQATAVLSSVERRLKRYPDGVPLSEEKRVTELTAIGALLDLLQARPSLIDQPLVNRSGEPHVSVSQLLTPVPVKFVNDTLYVTTPDSVFALRIRG